MRSSWRSAHPLPWQRVLVYGVVWTFTITAAQVAVLPLDGIPMRELWRTATGILAHRLFAGLALPAFAILIAPHLSLAPLLLASAAVEVGAHAISIWLSLSLLGDRAAMVAESRWATFLYNLWPLLVFGSPFIAFCVLDERARQTQAQFTQAELARHATERLLVQARLDTLRARIDPTFVVRVLELLQARYVQDQPAADRLLDRLVVFLRRATRGLAAHTSTLGEEIGLAQAHVQLCAECDHRAAPPDILVPVEIEAIAVPSFLLMPALERLTGSSLSVRMGPHAVELIVEGFGRSGWWQADVDARLRVALASACGSRWSLTVPTSTTESSPAWRLRLDSSSRFVPESGSRMSTQGVPPWPMTTSP
jgi:hypothetical protein